MNRRHVNGVFFGFFVSLIANFMRTFHSDPNVQGALGFLVSIGLIIMIINFGKLAKKS